MTKGTKQRRKRRTTAEVRQRIIEAAASEFAEKGYDRATSAAIARRAGVIEAQIFHHFGSKANLFRNVVFEPLLADLQTLAADVAADDGASATANLAQEEIAYTRRLQTFIADNAALLRSAYGASTSSPGEFGADAAIASLNAYFAQGAALNRRLVGDDPVIPPELIVRISFATVLGSVMFRRWLYDVEGFTDEEVADAIDRFVVHGLSINHRRAP